MSAGRRHRLEGTGFDQRQVGGVQRALDGIAVDLDGLEESAAAYTPGDATDWASPAPTTIKAALDRLADKVRALNGGTPIP